MIQLRRTIKCGGTLDNISLADVPTATSTSHVLKPWPVMKIPGAVLMILAAVGFSNAKTDFMGWLTGLAGRLGEMGEAGYTKAAHTARHDGTLAGR